MKCQVPQDFAARINQLLLTFNLTQVGLADLQDVSFASIKRWENGQAKPSLLAWQKIELAEALGPYSLEEKPLASIHEKRPVYPAGGSGIPDLDFSTPAEVILAVTEGYRLEGLGFTGQVVQIQGGMDYQQCEEAVAFYRKLLSEGGIKYLVATDAAGEGVNLQVCWLMVNYDIPWNPARLEQCMGRIHPRTGTRRRTVRQLGFDLLSTRSGGEQRRIMDANR